MMKNTSSFDELFNKKNDKHSTTKKERTTPPHRSPPSSSCDATEPDDSASTTSSGGYNLRSPTTTTTPPVSWLQAPPPPKILWCGIVRDDWILAEANDVGKRHDRQDVADAARQLLQQRCTPGFEYYTTQKHKRPGSLLLKKNRLRINSKKEEGDSPPPLKGIKFHVFEHLSDESLRNLQLDNDDDDVDRIESGTRVLDAAAAQRESTPHLRVWVFAAIFDPQGTNRHDVQSFLEKLVHITDSLRTYDPEWKIAKTLGLQASFAPILQQRMEEVTYLGKVALLQQQVHACQEQMEHNIDLMLDNAGRAEHLQEEASHLQDLCLVFKKKAKEVKRQHMLANAKYGLIAGTAVTGLAAVVIAPLVVAL